tara:strand:- start:114 stop:2636 length:2523 start_codon:yes stop_codon:yes gene_type:complete
MSKEFFPIRPEYNLRIYAYRDTNPQYNGLLRIGQTTRSVETRVKEQYPSSRPGKPPYEIVLNESAMRSDGTAFHDDPDLFKYLESKGVERPGGDFFKCDVKTIKSAILALRNRLEIEDNRVFDFNMRPEQEAAVNKTFNYFKNKKRLKKDDSLKFLWNAKMRFGKTFASYQLAKRMNWKRVLVLTFLPAVQSAWEEDLKLHIDFKDWQFISKDGMQYKEINKKKPFVCFGSFQDFLGKNKSGKIKNKNEWAHEINWDCIILDEYHYGSWTERAKEIYDTGEKDEYNEFLKVGISDNFDQSIIPITTDHYLYLSGTPFRALESGEFIEEQIYNWTYPDEQKAKIEWKKDKNPYFAMPRMVMLTYKLPSNIEEIAKRGEFDEFDLNEFFSAEGKYESAKFKHITEVQKWLDLIRGSFNQTIYDNLRQGGSKPAMPFSDYRIKKNLNHTVWYLPDVKSCHAMANLLRERQNVSYHEYSLIVAAGNKAGIGKKALPPVLKKMEPSPLNTKTITLTCKKLLTGVTVRPWTGIFMLRNTTSAQTYFQSAFRVQSPWTAKQTIENKKKLKEKDIVLKEECYVFDFAPNRTLKLVSDYCKLNTDINTSEEKKIDEFLKFLPILSYDGFDMHSVDANEVLEVSSAGTSSTLLAKKWMHDSLIYVDNITLQRILSDDKAIEVLMKIEGFRNIKEDIETIINKSSEIKNLKRNSNKLSDNKNKKQLTDAEKEYKSKKEMIKKKLKQFASRIPIFMYLTDYRENHLEDVITKLDTKLFRKVTGLEIKDFELLVNKGVFNKPLMNLAIKDFKTYEDSSLQYLGITTHKFERYGLMDTVITKKEFKKYFVNQTI